MKPLGAWMPDLVIRVDFFSSWCVDALPRCWWLPALTYPTGFLTAVLQVGMILLIAICLRFRFLVAIVLQSLSIV
jgi:hypothetical protein